MARSRTRTLLSLDRYGAVMGLSVIHFNNLQDNAPTSATRPFWNQALHDDLAVYIAQAEAMLRDGLAEAGKSGLGFDVAPAYRQDKVAVDPITGAWPSTGTGAWPSAGTGAWQDVPLRTPYGHVQAFGSRASAKIASGTVSFSGDVATVQVTAATSGMAPGEVQVFYTVADRTDPTATTEDDTAWRIRDLSVTVNGTTITIRGHKAQFVKPSVLDADDPAPYSEANSFVTQVEVYRVYTDPETPLSLVWDTYGETLAGDPATDTTQTGAARLLDGKQGLFQARPATYSSGAHEHADPLYLSPPDAVEVAYLAGYPLDDAGQERLDARLEMAVVRLANVLSPDFAHWLNDLAQVKWRGDRRMPTVDNPLQPGEEDCPFGLQQGARYAWRVVRQLRLPADPGWRAV